MAVPTISATLALPSIQAGSSTTLSVVANDPDTEPQIFEGDVQDAFGHVQHVTVTQSGEDHLTLEVSCDDPGIVISGTGTPGVYTITALGLNVDGSWSAVLHAVATDRDGNEASTDVLLEVQFSASSSGETSAPPDSVTIGTHTHDVNGVNTYRGIDQMIVYSCVSQGAQEYTPTNQYGVEVVVVGGIVTAVNDRVSHHDRTRTPIPDEGFVVSGHAAALPRRQVSAADWLREVAVVGAEVQLTKAGQVTSWPIPATDLDSGEQDSGSSQGYSGLADSFVASCWWYTWEGPAPDAWPDDVKDIVNLIPAAMADSSEAGTGKIHWDSAGMTKARIDAITSRGVPFVVGIGGSSNNGKIKLLTDQNVDEMFSSISAMRSTYGITGVDYDLETAWDWDPHFMAKLSSRLKQTFGPTFVVGQTAALYGALGAQHLRAAQLQGDDLDYLAVMLYDFEETMDNRLVGVAQDKIDMITDAGIGEHKVILGFKCQVPGSTENCSPVALAENAVRTALQHNFDLRGVFIWQSDREASTGWAFTRQVLGELEDM